MNFIVQLFETPPRDLVPLIDYTEVKKLLPSSYVAIEGPAWTLEHSIKVIWKFYIFAILKKGEFLDYSVQLVIAKSVLLGKAVVHLPKLVLIDL